MVTIVWIRRDLRLHDQAALSTALAEKAAVQPVFVFDTGILARFNNPHDRRLSFIMGALCGIDRELKRRGGGLLVMHGKACEVIPKLAAALGAQMIVSAEDFEPDTRARDAEVKRRFSGRFVQVIDHVLRAPCQIQKDDGTPLKVFTPYYKRWLASLSEMDWAAYEVKDKGRYADVAASRKAAEQAGLKVIDLSNAADALNAIGYRYVDDPLWKPGAARELLAAFTNGPVTDYPKQRDFMGVRGTSRLGPYLRHGLVSVRECVAAAQKQPNSATWIKELCWREFYMMILFHWPEVQTQEFQPQYRGTIPWDSSPRVKDALYNAKTGYPVIDAALREILQTGWMHNRARMIVASFFTKDLLMDWRVGEEFFAQHLMDYELASNNGGWQWSASTGTDAQPYFRVFNPLLQSQKFDPNGDYIRHYVPELKDVPDADIHWPHGTLYCPKDYPAPIVDHAAVKARAIQVFKDAKVAISAML